MSMNHLSRSRRTTSLVSGHRRQEGFTLIEVTIVVVIIAILASLAYTSYTDSLIKSRRKAATACMQESAQFLERYYTTNLSYALAVLPPSTCRTDLGNFYDWPLPTLATRTYSLQAVPKGVQSAKDKCGTLTIDQAGTKTRSGTLATTECFP
jgi:type IV pilus assembly protein PilE